VFFAFLLLSFFNRNPQRRVVKQSKKGESDDGKNNQGHKIHMAFELDVPWGRKGKTSSKKRKINCRKGKNPGRART